MKNIYKLFFVWAVLSVPLSGCTKLDVVPPPTTSLVNTSVFTSNSTASAAVMGIYIQMMKTLNSISGTQSMTSLLGLSADEFQNYPNSATVLSQAFTNSLSSNSSFTLWDDLYNYIYLSNAAIQGLNNSTGVTSPLKQQLLGQALFVRAFMHFYLVNIYGDVPLVLTTNYVANSDIARTPKAQVYQQIIADLKQAQSLMSADFVDPTGAVTTERTLPNKGAATALLARAYLYTGDYNDAAVQATSLINNNSQYSLVNDLNSVFLANSNEAIWQLEPVRPGFDTFDGYCYVLTTGPNSGSTNPIFLNPTMLTAFETGDQRMVDWVNSASKNGVTYYYPFKYKVRFASSPVPEYLMVLRLAEQYLIRAEANAQPGGSGNLSQAIADLNVIRNRAGLPNTTANTQPDVLNAIYQERRVELFAEWGHRWLDLKRTGQINAVMSVVTPQKGGSWNPDWQLYPLLNSEISADPHLVQNPGY